VFDDEHAGSDVTGALTAAGLSIAVESTRAAALDHAAAADAFVVGRDLSLVEVLSERTSVPVVCVPADGSERLASDALAAGATDYLPREAAPDALAERVTDAIADGHDDLERFRALVEHSRDVVSILGPEGTFEYVSPSVERILGHDQSDLVGTNAFDRIHPEDREAVTEQFFAAVEDPDYHPTVEFRYENADGEWRIFEARGKSRLDDPAIQGFVVTSRDVTERRERERALRTERALVEGILRTIPDTVYAFDEDGDPIREELVLSDGLLGYTREELIDAHPLEFVPEEDRAPLADAIERILDGEGPESYESAIVSKQGERVPHEFNGARLTDETGDVLGVVGTARDVTDRREHERELQRQNDRLEEFASVVSHDLRNPLNVVAGHVDLARRADDPTPHLDTIDAATDRMEAMISGLLSLARQGRTIGDLDPVALRPLVTSAWEPLDAPDATLTVEDPGTVQADGPRLHELFTNLLRNAVEHGSDEVSVRVGALDDGFYVADDGPGIPTENHEDVLAHGYTTSSDGTGLGLAIVARVVEAHGWTLDVTESADGGARFEVTGVERSDRDHDDGTIASRSPPP